MVAAILTFTFKAYRVTSQPFLINFFLGFMVLEASSFFALLNLFFGNNRVVYDDTLWIHQTTQTTALALIASTYYFKDRNITKVAAPMSALIFLGVLSLTLLTYLTSPPSSVFPSPEAVNIYFYTFGLLLLSYVFYNSVRVSATIPRKSNAFAPAGFGTLVIGQVSWLIWGLSGKNVAFLLANLSLVIGLALFTAALAKIMRR